MGGPLLLFDAQTKKKLGDQAVLLGKCDGCAVSKDTQLCRPCLPQTKPSLCRLHTGFPQRCLPSHCDEAENMATMSWGLEPRDVNAHVTKRPSRRGHDLNRGPYSSLRLGHSKAIWHEHHWTTWLFKRKCEVEQCRSHQQKRRFVVARQKRVHSTQSLRKRQ